ncbi:MAG: hypothetical protein DI539_27140 [Flavobacterium psychrophilum]|nr:MAG: hypothetical protein DI539_27140 [Flavobacterium psychrophilum]
MKVANINIVDKDYQIPLHIACQHGRLEVAELLLRKGANITVKDSAGNIPWDLAFKSGFADKFSKFKRKLIHFKVDSLTKQLKVYKTFHVNQNFIFSYRRLIHSSAHYPNHNKQIYWTLIYFPLLALGFA